MYLQTTLFLTELLLPVYYHYVRDYHYQMKRTQIRSSWETVRVQSQGKQQHVNTVGTGLARKNNVHLDIV